MKKGLVITFFVLMLVIPMVLAMPTTLKIKTLPNHDVDVTFLAPADEEYTVFVKTKGFSDYYGDLEISQEVDNGVFDIGLFVKDNNGEKVIYERFTEDYTSGSTISLEIAPEGYEFKENPLKVLEKTEEEIEINGTLFDGINISESEVTVEDVELSPDVVEENIVAESITGNVVGNVGEIFKKSKYYIIGGIAIVMIMVVLIVGFKRSNSNEVKKSALHSDDRPPTIFADKELEDAEKRLGEAERELKDVRSKYTKRVEAQEKFKKAQEELAEAEKSFADVKEDEKKDSFF